MGPTASLDFVEVNTIHTFYGQHTIYLPDTLATLSRIPFYAYTPLYND